MKKVAILQSNYIPWKGYFDMIHQVDEFILYDNVQYTRRDWRNRNKIQTFGGVKWLTIPVDVKGKFFQSVADTKISDPSWAQKHWQTIRMNYARAPYFKTLGPKIEELYHQAESMEYLSEVNYLFITEICKILGIHTKISWSTDYPIVDGKNERLIGLVQAAGGNHYLSGPAAQDYIDESMFRAANLELEWMNYAGYPEYSQLQEPFEHAVSILDLLFNTGEQAPYYIWGWRKK